MIVTFERIGRSHDVPPLTLDDALTGDETAAAIYTVARRHLMSRDVEVVVDGDRVHIFAGMHNGGGGTITRSAAQAD